MENKEVEKLQEWYLRFIESYRSEIEKLSDKEKEMIKETNDFRSPCQIEVFWLKEPSFQMIVRSNFENRKDMEIIVNGPYQDHEFIEKAKETINQSRWQRSLKNSSKAKSMFDERSMYTEMLAKHLHRLMETANKYKFTPLQERRKEGRGMGFLLGDDAWLDHYVGNIADSDPISKVNDIIKEIKTNAKSREEQLNKGEQSNMQPTMPNTMVGYGAHFFPPIFVGEKQRPTVEQLLHGNTFDISYMEKAFDTKFNDHVVVVNKDGFIFISISEKKTALKILNLIMSVGLFHGIHLFAVREHELGDVECDKKTMTISSMQLGMGTIRSVLFEAHRGKEVPTGYQRKEINEKKLRDIITTSVEIWNSKSLIDEFTLLIEAYTHYIETEYSQSFVMSWSIIEKYLTGLWERKLVAKHIQGQRYDKLTNTGLWSVDHILEILNLDDAIDEANYIVISDLKKKRNKFYHTGEPIEMDIANKSLQVAEAIILKNLSPSVQKSIANSLADVVVK